MAELLNKKNRIIFTCFLCENMSVYLSINSTDTFYTSVADPELLPGSGIIVPDPAKSERADN